MAFQLLGRVQLEHLRQTLELRLRQQQRIEAPNTAIWVRRRYPQKDKAFMARLRFCRHGPKISLAIGTASMRRDQE